MSGIIIMVAIKTILVPFYGDEKELPAVEAALMLGKRFKAHVTCLHISPSATAFGYGAALVPAHVSQQVEQAVKDELKEQAIKARKWFENAAAKANVTITNELRADEAISTASWQHEADKNADTVIAHAGRLADLIVISRHITESHESYSNAITAALFESGRPVLVMPPEAPQATLGENIVIAWDGSAIATHAVAAARPFLTEADKVRILYVEDGSHNGPLPQELTLYLLVHKVVADFISVDKGGLAVGPALLKAAKSQGADMLIMGAFSHSRIREMVLGGTTSHMLAVADIPVLMMH
jgi:nucleotide-binding universal stress UspA family protein